MRVRVKKTEKYADLRGEMCSMIPYGRQAIEDEDIQAVVDVLRSDWLTCGPAVQQFEEVVKNYIGAKHAIAVSNGTAALHLCCLALGIGPGATGVSSPLTFLASSNCIAYCGGHPDFVDVDSQTYCLSPEALETYIQEHGVPSVVIPVDFAGVPCDLPAIHFLAQTYGFPVIEDAAHSLGTSYQHHGDTIRCGACVHSDLAIFSFHPVKTVTAGEGGMVLTNDDDLAAKVRMLASHGMERDLRRFQPWNIDNKTGELSDFSRDEAQPDEKAPWLYQQLELGFNYRISDIQCALGASQFSRLDATIRRRRAIFDCYQAAFSDNTGLACPPCPQGTDVAYHLYVLRFLGSVSAARSSVCASLRSAGILSQVHYIPIYLQPWYQEHFGYQVGKCPEAEAIYENCLSIPLFPSMEDRDVESVIAAVNDFVGYY